MPRVLPNTTTADTYPGLGQGGAQIGIGDIFGTGFFVVANQAVFCQYFHGANAQQDNSSDIYLPPGTYPLQGTDKDPLGGIKFKSANIGKPAQVFGVFYYPDEAQLLASAEFTANVSPNGSVTGTSVMTGKVDSAGNRIAGTGFTSARTALGTYHITFTSPFAAIPVLTVAQVVAALTSNSIAVGNTTVNGFDVFSQTGGIGAVDIAFDFTAQVPV